MIIQIRGTSGSGKTTAMREIMRRLPLFTRNSLEPVYVSGRRNPLYYTDGGCASVIGSYESTCGGVDTIHGYEELQRVVRERREVGHVLMEGLLLSEDSKQTIAMLPYDIRCIFLSTDIDECLRRVQGRRAAKGNTKPLNPANTTNRVGTIERARVKLEAAGIRCVGASGNQTPDIVIRWLNES